jgi:hypothetical protein
VPKAGGAKFRGRGREHTMVKKGVYSALLIGATAHTHTVSVGVGATVVVHDRLS